MDLEFSERGPGFPIELISIGMVAQDGRELYLQSVEFDAPATNLWVKEHVLTQLSLCPCCGGKHHHAAGKCEGSRCPWRTLAQIRDDLLAFIDMETYGKPELWGYYAAYDHVVFAQIFGTMVDLPRGFPMYTRDLKQWCDLVGNPRLPRQDAEECHHALSDARHNRDIYDFLTGYTHSNLALINFTA